MFISEVPLSFYSEVIIPAEVEAAKTARTTKTRANFEENIILLLLIKDQNFLGVEELRCWIHYFHTSFICSFWGTQVLGRNDLGVITMHLNYSEDRLNGR